MLASSTAALSPPMALTLSAPMRVVRLPGGTSATAPLRRNTTPLPITTAQANTPSPLSPPSQVALVLTPLQRPLPSYPCPTIRQSLRAWSTNVPTTSRYPSFCAMFSPRHGLPTQSLSIPNKPPLTLPQSPIPIVARKLSAIPSPSIPSTMSTTQPQFAPTSCLIPSRTELS